MTIDDNSMVKKAIEKAAATGRIIGYSLVYPDDQDINSQMRDIIAHTKKTVEVVPQIAMETAVENGYIIGYARVSTDAHDTIRQVRDIIAYTKKTGARAPQIVTEIASGAKDRPELMATIAGLVPGDTLIVTEFSRLTLRGIPELLEIARKVTGKGAALVEIRSGMRYDNTAIGKLLILVTETFDRMERERIGERTKSALQARKAAGMKLGRPAGKSKLDEKKVEIMGYQKMELSKAKIAKLVGCSRSTYLAWLEKETEKVGK
jgi:DNA invertase Pin-like site-specific DNA recombinase